LFYESDVFDSVHLIDAKGKVLWSEPSAQERIETQFEKFDEISKKVGTAPTDVSFLTSEGPAGLDLLVVSPLTDSDGRLVGLLIGDTPASHPAIHTILRR